MVAIILKLNSITVIYIATVQHVQCKDLRYTLEGGYISVSKPQGIIIPLPLGSQRKGTMVLIMATSTNSILASYVLFVRTIITTHKKKIITILNT